MLEKEIKWQVIDSSTIECILSHFPHDENKKNGI